MSQTLIGPNGWVLLYCSLIVGGIGVWLWWSGRPHPRWEAFKRAVLAHFPAATASGEKAKDPKAPAPNQSAADKTAVQNQPDKAGTTSGTEASVSGKTAADQPAKTAVVSVKLDGISTTMTDVEITALLAVQRRPDGSYRYSANDIAKLGGSREKVLNLVRQIRASGESESKPAEESKPAASEAVRSGRFKLTPAQRQFRKQLGLDRA